MARMPTRSKKGPLQTAKDNLKTISVLTGIGPAAAEAKAAASKARFTDPNKRRSSNIIDKRSPTEKAVQRAKLQQRYLGDKLGAEATTDYDYAVQQSRLDTVRDRVIAQGSKAVRDYNEKVRSDQEKSFVHEKRPKPRPKNNAPDGPTYIEPKAGPSRSRPMPRPKGIKK